MIREDIHDGMVAYIRVCGNKPDVYTPDMCAEDLMEFLHSQGVVIKEEGELPRYWGDWRNPENNREISYKFGVDDTRVEFKEAGYTKWSPLI